jgi:hypothetical protein
MPHTSSTANGAPTEQQPLAGMRGALSRAPGVGGTSARSEEDATHMLLVATGATADAVEEIGQEDEAGDRSVCCQAMWAVSCWASL